MSAKDHLVSFEVECASTRPGDHVRVVGSLPALGAWVPEQSPVVLGTTKEAFPLWRSEWFSIPLFDEPCEYKYVICSKQGAVRWEILPNRRLHPSPKPVPGGRLEIKEAFGNQEVEFADAMKEIKEAFGNQEVEFADAMKERAVEARCGSKESMVPRCGSKERPPRCGSKESQSTCANGEGAGRGEDDDLIPAIPSWDSWQSTITSPALGELGAIPDSDTCESQEVTLSSQVSSCRTSLASTDLTTFAAQGARCSPEFPECANFQDGFELGRMLGEGAFGVVYKCTGRHNSKEYAVKVVEQEGLHPLDQAALLTEIRLQQAFPTHDHIVSLHGSFDEAGVMKLVMDVCLGGDLYAQIDDLKQRHRWKGGDFALSERAAATVTRQLLSALSFCHSQGVVHRDVKPGNVLIMHPVKQVPLETSAASVKLCDFGYATECSLEDPPALREFVGSPEYLAPEVARRQDYGCAVDVWSAGVVLFECLRGRVPFDADTEKEIINLVRKADCVYDEAWSRFSDEARSCTQQLLTQEVQHRPLAAQALGHPWLCGF